MTNRRNFLKTVACATAGTFVVGRFAAAQSARREVSLGGRRVKVVDIHAHCGVQEVEDIVRGTNLARTIGAKLVLGPERLRLIDERGIDVQVLSVIHWWYAADEDLARQIIRVQDEGIAAWCDAHPDRFVGLTSVALQHPDLAAQQLEYAVKNLGLRGASIGGHIEGEVPSSPRFDPFWAKAEELGVPVFIHPSGAANVVRKDGLKGRLENIIGNPLETTVFFSHMIFDGTLDRFPGLRICGAHGGGYLPSYLGRSEVPCRPEDVAECVNKKPPSEYLKTQIFADTMVFSEEGLRHLVAEMGVGQVVYGTDLPYDWPDTLDLILNAPFLSNAEKEAIVGGNVIRLLRIA